MYRLVLLALFLPLAACFASEKPLINETDASWPFKDGQIVRVSANCAVVGEDDDNCKGVRSGFAHANSMKIERVENSYKMDEIDQQAVPAEPSLFVLARIGEGGDDYVLQGDTGAQEGNVYRFNYFLVRIRGATAYVYGFNCRKADQDFVQQGLLKRIDPRPIWGPVCEAKNLQKLGLIFEQRLAAGEAPLFKWDLDL